jgi:hypothetical protein
VGCNIKKIGWKVSGLSADLASVRYRAILPLISLEKIGIQSKIIPLVVDADLDSFDAIIIVKSFTPDDLYLAQQANAKKIPVFFDLCDNIFIEAYRGKQIVTPAEVFLTMAPYFSGVLVTTIPLKLIVEEVLSNSVPVYVVPDGVETKRDVDRAKKILNSAIKSEIKKNIQSVLNATLSKSVSSVAVSKQKIKAVKHHLKINIQTYLKPLTWVKKTYATYDHIRSRLTGKPRKAGKSFSFFSSDTFSNGVAVKKSHGNKNVKRVLWFGNHGAKHAQFGMLDLLPLRESFESLNKETPLELIVVSNNKEKFIKHISRFNCITRYVEWSSEAVDAMLNIADAVVVPNSKDAFSICKSSNRTVMALNANVPVVADLTPALKDLQDAIYIDDFYSGLKKCFNDSKDVKNRIALGKEKIKEKYGKSAIANIFLQIFNKTNIDISIYIPKNAIIVLMHLVQDFELAKPIIDRLKATSVSYMVWISFSLVKKAPKILQYLKSENVIYFCLPDDISLIQYDLFSSESALSVLSIAETNLGPHRFTHAITQKANEAGIQTFTMQHGFENVGLTYSDSVHKISEINIAAKTILIWGDVSTLHPEIKPEIREKAIAIGCSKDNENSPLTQSILMESVTGKVIGIFENLHWHRYSQYYQDNFLSAVSACAKNYPSIIFLIKPHPAGMWLTSRFKGSLPEADNIIIADPIDPEWEKYSANDFLDRVDGVISTPSTIILDAARKNLPTLVSGFDLTLNNYQPLKISESVNDWFAFIDNIVEGSTENLLAANNLFVGRNLVSGDAVEKIISKLLENKK